MEIYLDVLIMENLVMNYLILMLTAKFSHAKTSSFRLFLGALAGALYVVVLIMLPGLKIYYTAAAKILLSLAIIAIAFSPDKVKSFIKTLVIFYISTFVFAGAAFSFIYINQNGGFVRNGIVYVFWQSKWSLFVLSVLTALIILKVFYELIQMRLVREKLLVPLKIAFESSIIELPALIDTGNSLHDPLTNTPVVVVEFNAIKEALPSEIKSIFLESKENDLTSVTNIVASSSWFPRFRLIPFTSLGKENGMLIGFKPDYIRVGEEGEKGIEDVIVGIHNKALSKNSNYMALLSPDIV